MSISLFYIFLLITSLPNISKPWQIWTNIIPSQQTSQHIL